MRQTFPLAGKMSRGARRMGVRAASSPERTPPSPPPPAPPRKGAGSREGLLRSHRRILRHRQRRRGLRRPCQLDEFGAPAEFVAAAGGLREADYVVPAVVLAQVRIAAQQLA